MGDQRRFVRLGPVAQFDEGAGALAPAVVRHRHHGAQAHRRMAIQRLLDLDGRDVLAARDDDVLGPVLQLHIAVRVHHPQVARMEPAAGKGFVGRGRVLQVALHHQVAAEHDLAQRLAVGRHLGHGLRVAHRQGRQRQVAHPLPRLQRRLPPQRQRVPVGVPVVDHAGTIGLGQAVEMGDAKAGGGHGRQHTLRRRCGGGVEEHRMVQCAPLGLRGVQQRRHDDRRAAQMGHAVAGDGVIDRAGAHPAKADLRAGLHRQRPGKAPAVAVKHRQGPQIDRIPADLRVDGVVQCHQRGAAVVIDDALRIAGRARGIVQRKRVPFVPRPGGLEIRVAAGDEGRVILGADGRTLGMGCVSGIFGVVIVDHQRPHRGHRQRLGHDRCELAVHDHHLRLGMVELEGDLRRVEAGVHGMQHRAVSHRHAVMRLDHRRRVRQHDRDRIAAPHAARPQGRGQPPAVAPQLGIGDPRLAVDHGDPGRMGQGRAFQIDQRRQRLMVRVASWQVVVVLHTSPLLSLRPTPGRAHRTPCSAGSRRHWRAGSTWRRTRRWP